MGLSFSIFGKVIIEILLLYLLLLKLLSYYYWDVTKFCCSVFYLMILFLLNMHIISMVLSVLILILIIHCFPCRTCNSDVSIFSKSNPIILAVIYNKIELFLTSSSKVWLPCGWCSIKIHLLNFVIPNQQKLKYSWAK